MGTFIIDIKLNSSFGVPQYVKEPVELRIVWKMRVLSKLPVDMGKYLLGNRTQLFTDVDMAMYTSNTRQSRLEARN